MQKSVLCFLFSAGALWVVGCENGGPGSETLSFDGCTTGPGTYTGNLTSNGVRDSVNFLAFGSCTDASGSVGLESEEGSITLSCGGPVLVCAVTAGSPDCGLGVGASDGEQSISAILDPDQSEPWLDCADAPAGTVCLCDPSGTVTTSYL